jgi:heat-inducible transcriptional repressor
VSKPRILGAKLKSIVRSSGIYCLVNRAQTLKLEEIISVDERYLVLVLGGEALVLGYSEPVARFLPNLIGANVSELESIGAQVGLHELSQKASRLKDAKVLLKEGEMCVYEMAKTSGNPKIVRLFLDPRFPDSLTDGLYFEDMLPQGYMAIKQSARYQGEDAELFCVGGLYTDYERFFDAAKEDL